MAARMSSSRRRTPQDCGKHRKHQMDRERTSDICHPVHGGNARLTALRSDAACKPARSRSGLNASPTGGVAVIPVLPARGLQPVCVHADPAPPTPLPLRESSEPRLGPRSRSPSAALPARRPLRQRTTIKARSWEPWRWSLARVSRDDFFHGPGVGGPRAEPVVLSVEPSFPTPPHARSRRKAITPLTSRRADRSGRDKRASSRPIRSPSQCGEACGWAPTSRGLERLACSWQHPRQHPDRPFRPPVQISAALWTIWTHRTDLTGGLQG